MEMSCDGGDEPDWFGLEHTPCTKNTGHQQFISVHEFTLDHLPRRYREESVLDCIRTIAGLTCRLLVQVTSRQRPQICPDTGDLYPFSSQAGRSVLETDTVRAGSGFLSSISTKNKNFGDTLCPCEFCADSESARSSWVEVEIVTAKHVVFDGEEARSTIIEFFYDDENRREETVQFMYGRGSKYLASPDMDISWITCVTHDVRLSERLHGLKERSHRLHKTLMASCSAHNNKIGHAITKLRCPCTQTNIGSVGVNLPTKAPVLSLDLAVLPNYCRNRAADNSKSRKFILWPEGTEMIQNLDEEITTSNHEQNRRVFSDSEETSPCLNSREVERSLSFVGCEGNMKYSTLNREGCVVSICGKTTHLSELYLDPYNIFHDTLTPVRMSEQNRAIVERKIWRTPLQNDAVENDTTEQLAKARTPEKLRDQVNHEINSRPTMPVTHRHEFERSPVETSDTSDVLSDWRLAVVISHPHGACKRITIGFWLKKCVEESVFGNSLTRYIYDTPTCPGSGGPVWVLQSHIHDVHVHSECLPDGLHRSSVGTGSCAWDRSNC